MYDPDDVEPTEVVEGLLCATSFLTGAVTSLFRTPTEAVVPPIPPGCDGAGAACVTDGDDEGREIEEEDTDRPPPPLDEPPDRPILPEYASDASIDAEISKIERSFVTFIIFP